MSDCDVERMDRYVSREMTIENECEMLAIDNKHLRKENELRKKYIKLLIDEIEDLVEIATRHGWKSKRYEEGKKIRSQLKALGAI